MKYKEKVFSFIRNKAKQLYTKMLIYICYIKDKVISLITEYKESASDTAKYFINLCLYIIMYGLPYCIALSVISNKYSLGIPLSIGWIYTAGLAWYTIKEEIPRIIRNSFPPRNNTPAI